MRNIGLFKRNHLTVTSFVCPLTFRLLSYFFAEQESRRILAEQESKRLEIESLERVKLRELEIRLTIEQGNAERQNFIGQGDVRTE